MTVLAPLVADVYAQAPNRVLYHYTGYHALLEIVRTGELWATDVHYFSDASELHHATGVFKAELRNITATGSYPHGLVEQLRDWLDLRLVGGHTLFALCFSVDGNLLSQWRGYTPHGNGVSLGFDPRFLLARAAAQDFRLGQCIYERARQQAIAHRAVTALLAHANATGPAPQTHPSQ